MTMSRMKYLCAFTIILLPLLFLACSKGKEASVEGILKDRLTEHFRITNEVFSERGKDTGKGTSVKLIEPVKVVVGKDGKSAVTDAAIEIIYVSENKNMKAPLRVTWELKDGNWSADKVFPEDFGFLIAFDQQTLDKLKKKQ